MGRGPFWGCNHCLTAAFYKHSGKFIPLFYCHLSEVWGMQVIFSIVLFIASPVRILVVLSRRYYNINTARRAYGILQSSAPAVREALQNSHYDHFISKQRSCAPSVTRAAVRLAFSSAQKHCKTKQSRFFFL